MNNKNSFVSIEIGNWLAKSKPSRLLCASLGLAMPKLHIVDVETAGRHHLVAKEESGKNVVIAHQYCTSKNLDYIDYMESFALSIDTDILIYIFYDAEDIKEQVEESFPTKPPVQDEEIRRAVRSLAGRTKNETDIYACKLEGWLWPSKELDKSAFYFYILSRPAHTVGKTPKSKKTFLSQVASIRNLYIPCLYKIKSSHFDWRVI